MTPARLISLIGQPSPLHVVLSDDQDASDIMRGMIKKHKECTEYYDKIYSEFSSGSVEQICKRLFNFCKSHLRYKEESRHDQWLSSPQTMLRRGHSDCKGYALFIGGVLDAMRRHGEDIEWFYRFASYKLFKNTPGHVFVVVVVDGFEIWVDPVFHSFNTKSPYWSAMDRRVNTPLAAVGCPCEDSKAITGLTTSQGGQALMKLAPSLSAVPVAALIVEGVGLLLTVFGNSFQQSPDVRWLVQSYQWGVLNQNVTSDNQVNESLTANAQKWFSYVIGVPVGDKLMFHTLCGTDPNTGKSLNQSLLTRAGYYVKYPAAIKAEVTVSLAVKAANIASSLAASPGRGAWANCLPAPWLIDDGSDSSDSGSGSGFVVSPLWFIAGAAALYFIIE